MRQSPIEEKLTKLLKPVTDHRGVRLVALRMNGPTLEILVENPQTRSLGVDECAKLSREFSALLDVENIIPGAYRLEVGSPGIDRPLIELKDFEDAVGLEAKIEIEPALPTGQKRFRGRVRGVKNNEITIETEDQGSLSLPFISIQKAKLILTDELIKQTKKKEVSQNGTAASC